MHKGLKEPHVLLASSNTQKLLRNIAAVIGQDAVKKIQDEIDRNARGLFHLGEHHMAFAGGIQKTEWRQRMSRLYYAAYNVKRAISLKHDGAFSTDSSDHKKIDELPKIFPNHAVYSVKLRNLRDDRNLADYSHLEQEADLLIPVEDAETLVTEFTADARTFLKDAGLNV